MSPKNLFVVMVAFLAIPTLTQAQAVQTVVVTAEPSIAQAQRTRLSPEEIQRRVDERAAQIRADKEEAKRVKDLRNADKTGEQKEARRQIEAEAKRDAKAFDKAKIVGCSPDETIVHPEANAKGWGPKVRFEIHNPHNYPFSILNGGKVMIENLCPKGSAEVSVSAWVMGPLVSYGSPYAPYGGRRRDGRDMKIVRLTARSEYGVVFSPPVVVDYYQVLYEGNPRDPYLWIVPDPPQGQVVGQAGPMMQMPGGQIGPGVSMFGTSRDLTVPMPGYIQRSLMSPSEREALDRQAEPVVDEEIIEIPSDNNPDDNR